MKKITDFAIIEKNSKKIIALTHGSTRIGRNSENNIRINHPICSKYHATITIRGTIIHFHDFSNNGSKVMKRAGFQFLRNETTRLYENSKICIADKEFKIIKLKNIKNEKTEIIQISDSESDDNIEIANDDMENKSESDDNNEMTNDNMENKNEVDNNIEITHEDKIKKLEIIKNKLKEEIADYDKNYEWKKMRVRNLILNSTSHETDSDSESEINPQEQSPLEIKMEIDYSGDNDNDSSHLQIKMETSSEEEDI